MVGSPCDIPLCVSTNKTVVSKVVATAALAPCPPFMCARRNRSGDNYNIPCAHVYIPATGNRFCAPPPSPREGCRRAWGERAGSASVTSVRTRVWGHGWTRARAHAPGMDDSGGQGTTSAGRGTPISGAGRGRRSTSSAAVPAPAWTTAWTTARASAARRVDEARGA